MKTGVFVQVRLASTRLPGKALLPLIGGNIIEHVMRALKAIDADVYALLTNDNSAEVLKPYAKSEKFELFKGPEEDVLKRYTAAIVNCEVDRVIRATGDNPLVSAKLAREIIQVHEKEGADLSHYIGIPWGTGIEVIAGNALLSADRMSTDPYEREHITTYIYRNGKNFKVVEADCPLEYHLPEWDVSLDTEDDYTLLGRIYSDLYRDIPIEIDELAHWLTQNSSLARRGVVAKKGSTCPGS